MQRPDERKREKIVAAAARLFARRPYHRVTLDAVAARARVGKGTLYVYFPGKEPLYAALIEAGFRQLLADLRRELVPGTGRARADLAAVLRALFAFARRFPHLFHLMRAGQPVPAADRLQPLRRRIMRLIADVVRAGVRRRELRDPAPGRTALYLPSLVRAVVLYAASDRSDAAAAEHILGVLFDGLCRSPRARRRTGRRPRPRARPRPRRRATRKRRTA